MKLLKALLTLSILIISLLSTQSYATPADEQEAINKAKEAFLAQSGIEKAVTDKANYYKDKYISKEVQTYAGNAALIVKIIQDKYISYKWTFK